MHWNALGIFFSGAKTQNYTSKVPARRFQLASSGGGHLF
jgi:hypothetical protein